MPTVEKRDEFRERLDNALLNKGLTVTTELGNVFIKDQNEITVKIIMTYEGVSHQIEEFEFPIYVCLI